MSDEELLNRVIKAKALSAICGRMIVTLHTSEGVFEISPKTAKKLLQESKTKFREDADPLRKGASE